jgi:hypothetical protein
MIVKKNTPNALFSAILAYLCFYTSVVFGQIQIGSVAGFTYNIPRYTASQGTLPANLFGNAIGGYEGLRLQYGVTKRFYLASELTYQVFPYKNRYFAGQFHPGYITWSVIPSFVLRKKMILEIGLGTGLTIVNRLEETKKNDPLLFSALGWRVPLGKWGLTLRYYRFLRPQYRLINGITALNFGSHGFQWGISYDLFGT